MKTDWRWEPYFTPSELCCTDSGELEMDSGFMDILLALRKHLDFPFVVTSGYRSPEYNDRISSTGRTGPHTTGKAVDILVSGERAFKVMAAAADFGFTGIGLNQKGEHSHRFIHLDTLEGELRPWVWTY